MSNAVLLDGSQLGGMLCVVIELLSFDHES